MFPSSPYDQPIRHVQTEEVIIFDDVDDAVARATVVGDPAIAFDYGLSLIRSGLLRAHALAKLLYKIRTVWELFNIEDPFEDVVFERMGIAKQTVDKYVRMWEAVFENQAVSEETKRLLMGRPIRDLLMLTAAVREGSINDEDLAVIANAPDRASIRDVIRDARGDATSSNTAITLSLVWREDAHYPKGTLVASRNGESEVYGLFNVDATSDLVKQAIERHINALNIREG